VRTVRDGGQPEPSPGGDLPDGVLERGGGDVVALVGHWSARGLAVDQHERGDLMGRHLALSADLETYLFYIPVIHWLRVDP
jgi:hypothetical protein